MRVLEASMLGAAVRELCLEVSTGLSPDVLSALEAARALEESPQAARAIDLIVENARVATADGVPLCQDTGAFNVFLDLGRDTCVEGNLQSACSAAVADATAKGRLRASVVSRPADERLNTGDNTPAFLDVSFSSGDETRLGVMAKGGGSEMASRAGMLAPGAGWEGIMDFACEVVDRKGAGSCPPLVLGLGIGGTFATVAGLAARALLRGLDEPAEDESAGRRQRELTDAVNRLGIGPGALGGRTTCLGTRIASAPCHMASLPVALCVCCHSLRRKVITV